MNLKSIALAAGAAVLALSPSAAFALSAGVLEQHGTNLRVLVSHGGAPIEARIVAVDENYNELKEARAFPDQLLITGDPKRVSMAVPMNTYAICAVADITYNDPNTQVATGMIIESCARVNPHKLQQGAQLNFGGRKTPGGQRLRNGLQNTEVQLIQQGEEGRTSS